MQFTVHGHHLELTDSLKERCRSHILDRVEKLVDDTAARLEIQLSAKASQQHSKGEKTCSIDLRAPGLAPIHVTELRPTMNEAIDLAADRLIEALRRGIGKRDAKGRESIRTLVDAAATEDRDEF